MINKSAESPVLGNLKAFRPVLQPLTALNMKPPFPHSGNAGGYVDLCRGHGFHET